MILTKEQIITAVETFFTGKPVKKVWLFGSYARGDADDKSDIDILVDVDNNEKVGWEYFGWHEELGEKVNKKVDVLSYGWVNKRIWPYVQKDMQLIYEK